MSSWSLHEDAGARAREAIIAGDRITTLRILAEQNGYDYAREVLRSLTRDVARRNGHPRPPAGA